MFLQRLSEYTDQLDELPPLMYQRLPVRYVIQLDATGRMPNLIDRGEGRYGDSPTLSVPYLKRESGIEPILLADHAEYTFGRARKKSNPERVPQCHAAYMALLRKCVEKTSEPTVGAILAYLEVGDYSVIDADSGFDPEELIVFRVGETYPTELPSVKTFWAEEARATDPNMLMECIVCGQTKPTAKRLALPVKGIRSGQKAGTMLISANENAFESYGLETSLIAPTCEDCGWRFGNAINALIDGGYTHVQMGDAEYIFWTREPTEVPFASWFSRAEPAEVRQLLEGATRSKSYVTSLDTTPFYAAMLSASEARVIVCDWIETTLREAQTHVRRYFQLQHLVDGSGKDRWFAALHLARATVRTKLENAKSKNEKPVRQACRAILNTALRGDPLPLWLLHKTVMRVRAQREIRPEQAALIKMVWLSQHPEKEAISDMAELDMNNREPAYLCGRLLAILASIQYNAQGETNSTIVEKYYGTASSAPGSAFPRLMTLAQHHLAKLRRDRRRRGAYVALQAHLEEVIDGLKEFPPSLSLIDQGLFTLGYYHQRSADYRARLQWRQRQGQEQGQELEPPDADFREDSPAEDGSEEDAEEATEE